MLATQKILMLSAVLLTALPARADQNAVLDPLLLLTPELPPSIESRSTGWLDPAFIPRSFTPVFKGDIQDAQGKEKGFAPDPRVGLHWDTSGNHPSLEYQFTDNGVMHFRGARHGAAVTATWSY